ncbi:MAG TPA: hypothetical protein VEK34_02735 [Methylocella sp.]|nr:hypothetical protein [Methylocella sp.]
MQKWALASVAAALLIIVVGYLAYGRRAEPCDNIVTATLPDLPDKLYNFNGYGEGIIGKEKVQEVDAHAKKVTELLKSCCQQFHKGAMTAEQQQACVTGAKNFVAKINEIATLFEDADNAGQEGNLNEMDAKVAQAQQLSGATAVMVDELSKLAEPASPKK